MVSSMQPQMAPVDTSPPAFPTAFTKIHCISKLLSLYGKTKVNQHFKQINFSLYKQNLTFESECTVSISLDALDTQQRQ